MNILFTESSTSRVGYAVDTVITLVGREMRVRYKGSLLGVLWAILSPLGTVLVLHMLFSVILPLNIPHYAAFVYSGLLPWTWFQSTVQTCATTLLDNRDLVRRPFFSRPLLPVVVTGTNFMLYLLALPVLMGILLIEGVPLSPLMLLLPAVWVVIAVLALAVGMLVAALGVLIRDIQHLLGVIMMFWFYLTPIFYNIDQVDPRYAQWLWLNPMTVLVQAHRQMTVYNQMPNWGTVGLCGAASGVLLVGSLALFRMLEDAFVEEV